MDGQSEYIHLFFNKNPNYIPVLKNILPISPIFNQIQIPSCVWSHMNTSLIQSALFSIANITASDDTIFLMLK